MERLLKMQEELGFLQRSSHFCHHHHYWRKHQVQFWSMTRITPVVIIIRSFQHFIQDCISDESQCNNISLAFSAFLAFLSYFLVFLFHFLFLETNCFIFEWKSASILSGLSFATGQGEAKVWRSSNHFCKYLNYQIHQIYHIIKVFLEREGSKKGDNEQR